MLKQLIKKGAGIGLAIRGIEQNAVLSFAGLEALYDYSIIVFPTKIEGASLPVNVTNAIFALSKNRGSDSYSYSTDEESEYAFCEDFDDLKLVVIPSTVYLIDDGYFVDCKNLERVVLGSNVNEIGASAFQGCASLKTINFPKNLEVIASSAFDDCDSLENIVVVKNSYGEDYCKENNLPYSYIDGSLPSGAQESEQVIDMTEESLSEIWCGKYDMQNSEGNWTFTVDYVTSSWDGSFGILLWDIYNEDTDEGFYKKTHQMEFGLSDDGLSINYYDGYFTMVLDTNTNSITLDADDDTISGVYTRVD